MKLHIHLFCNFLCEVLLFLLQTLAGLETNELLDGKCRADLLGYLIQILRNRLLAILSLYIYLIQQTDLLQLLVQTALIMPSITFSGFWDSFGSFII